MGLVPSLLHAIVQADGEALVLHAGDKPYVVAPGGQVDLASRGLTLDAVNGIVTQLLPAEVMHALDEFGAAQYQLPARVDFPHEQFSVVAARGGDDLWVEIRRRRIVEEDAKPDAFFGPAPPTVSAEPSEPADIPVAALDSDVEEVLDLDRLLSEEAAELAPPPAPPPPAPEAPPHPGVVLPLARSPIRPEAAAAVTGQVGAAVDRLLRLAAARGASTLYLATDNRPSVRVDGENQALEGEPVLTAHDVESLLLALMPERNHEALRAGADTEWIFELEGIGRVRAMRFIDQRGPGGVFRLMPPRAVSAEQLALPREIQALAMEPEGLILVVGPRSSGKRTLIAALIDRINRTRRDHVISIEKEINILHDRGTSLISQREVRGGDEEVLAAARAALREDPDVLAIEDIRSGDLMNVALDAAASGRLVVGGFPAHGATSAIDRIIDLYAPQYRRQIQMALAAQIRGVVAQVLVRKRGGGRLAARELLLNIPAVASLIAEGRTSQIPMAIEAGRRQGLTSLNDALVGYVQSGAVDSQEAYRRAADRPGFLALLERQGIDTSSLERPA